MVPVQVSQSWQRLEVFQLLTRAFLACDHWPPVMADIRYGAHSEVHNLTCLAALLDPLTSALATYAKSMTTVFWAGHHRRFAAQRRVRQASFCGGAE